MKRLAWLFMAFLLMFPACTGKHQSSTDDTPADSTGVADTVPTDTLEELIASVDRGLILGGFSGGQPGTNGEFSGVAKNSFLIENGKVKCAVTETMVNGNLGEAFRNIRGITAEVLCDGGSVVPYIAVDGIVISGK